MIRYSVVALSLFFSSAAIAQDVVLDAMKEEMKREVEGFAKVKTPPYFISYRVIDQQDGYVGASLGSLMASDESRARMADVQVRIGDYQFDNSHPIEEMDFQGGGANGSQQSIPTDDKADVIRYSLWRATDAAYRESLERYELVKNHRSNNSTKTKVPDFSRETVETYFEPALPKLADMYDRTAWEAKVRRLSAMFKVEPAIVDGSVNFNILNHRKYYLSTEGTSVVQNAVGAYVYLSASIRATDGELVPLHQSYYAPDAKSLPSDEVIERDIREMISTLQKLRVAPLADPYTGPALLDGPVAGVFFHEIFGHRVEGHRLRSDFDGQTFKSKVDKRILPETISVYCDPTLPKFADTFLNGRYAYDDEGVKSKKVTIVDKGMLRNFLMSRSPMDNFLQSNGHGRSDGTTSPVSRQSNLLVEAAKTKSNAELRQMLIKECQRQKKEYGYFFKNVDGGYTFTDRYTPNAFNIFPTVVYRIYADGRPDELVRGVDLIGTPLAMFAEITAVGNTPGVFTGYCGAESGYVPVSAISPSLFVRRIETQKKPKTKTESPIISGPSLDENK